MSDEKTKDIFLLERTKDSVSNIIGFYSSEEKAVQAVERHVLNHIRTVVTDRIVEDPASDHLGIYIQEGFLISRNEVEIDKDADFDKIEDPEEFPEDLKTPRDVRVAPEAGLAEERVEGREYNDGAA
jgi:hypothetical protein